MVDLQVKHNSKTLPLGTFASLSIALSIALGTMYTSVFIGLHPIVSTVLMVGLLILVLYFLSCEATFTIRENKLERLLLSSNFLFKNKVERTQNFSDIISYKNGTDKGKYRGEFQYLEIKFRNSEVWKISDMYGERKEGYDNFLRHFLSQVNNYNQLQSSTELTTSTIQTSTNKLQQIKREKTFYESNFGKIYTIALGIFIVLLLVYGKEFMNGSATYKLNAVLIPGFAYLFYRTFLSKKK
ncbi:MAG: hypothetical protein IPF58_11890 [Saprospirales bacterium]|nr:hypothetical protein [Saprospirales bacterium]